MLRNTILQFPLLLNIQPKEKLLVHFIIQYLIRDTFKILRMHV